MIMVQPLAPASNDDNVMTIPFPKDSLSGGSAAHSTISSIRYGAQASLRMTSPRN
jgi:hypothetical protein